MCLSPEKRLRDNGKGPLAVLRSGNDGDACKMCRILIKFGTIDKCHRYHSSTKLKETSKFGTTIMDLVKDLRVDIRPLEAATSLVRSVGTGSSMADEVDGTGCSGKFTCILWHTSNACPTVRTILIAWLYNI